ncbi:MAG: hypothetical protein R2744_09275 [Bacteroidales bacterium]
MNLMLRRVDIVTDLHEAELQYPVINTIVAHESEQNWQPWFQ